MSDEQGKELLELVTRMNERQNSLIEDIKEIKDDIKEMKREAKQVERLAHENKTRVDNVDSDIKMFKRLSWGAVFTALITFIKSLGGGA
jgi:methyl-accepting chemotaxis protein